MKTLYITHCWPAPFGRSYSIHSFRGKKLDVLRAHFTPRSLPVYKHVISLVFFAGIARLRISRRDSLSTKVIAIMGI